MQDLPIQMILDRVIHMTEKTTLLAAALTGIILTAAAFAAEPATANVTMSTGAAMLIRQCYDNGYITSTAGYIVDGTVTSTEKDGDNIVSMIAVTNYEKGSSVGNRLRIVSGLFGEAPRFVPGENVRLFLYENGGTLSVVCGINGVQRT